MNMAADELRTVPNPKVWLVVGDKQRGRYPIYFCAAGDNSGSIIVGYVLKRGYEVLNAACEAYNEQRNSEEPHA